MTDPNDEAPPIVEIKLKGQREMNMALARLAGATYRQIGAEFGLSRQRVCQILNEIEQQRSAPLFGHAGEIKNKKKLGNPKASAKYPGHPVHYFAPGEKIFREPTSYQLRTFKGQVGRTQRRKDVEVCRDLFSKLGRIPYMTEVAKVRYPNKSSGSIAGPILTSHWVSRRNRTGKHSYGFYRNRMYIAAFGWGTKAPDGRAFLAELAQKVKDSESWLTA